MSEQDENVKVKEAFEQACRKALRDMSIWVPNDILAQSSVAQELRKAALSLPAEDVATVFLELCAERQRNGTSMSMH